MLGAEPGVALVAVGGYGRKELLPGSDLDVLMLHDGRDGIAKIADRIWYPVWDSGAHLDHAVRTVPQARRVARNDLKVALGLLNARHVAGDPDLTTRLREVALEDWRSNARTRLAELKELHEERTRLHGELAFLLEPDLKESRGGQRDVHAIQAIAAAWVAPAPGPKVRAAYEQILDARHVLHEVTGRRLDRLVLEEQDEVARTLDLLDGDALLRQLAGAGRTVAYARRPRLPPGGPGGRRAARSACGCAAGKPDRRPLADGVVEQDGEVVLARAASPATDPVLVLRAAAAAAQAGLPLAPRAPGPAGRVPAAARPVARRRPQRPARPARRRAERDRRLGGARPGGTARRADPGLGPGAQPPAAQPAAPLHRRPAPRRVRGQRRRAGPRRVAARPAAARRAAARHRQGLARRPQRLRRGRRPRRVQARSGSARPDVQLVADAVRHHLLLPDVATRRDLDDPMTVQQVADDGRLADAARAAARALAGRRARHRPGGVERLEGRPGRRSRPAGQRRA